MRLPVRAEKSYVLSCRDGLETRDLRRREEIQHLIYTSLAVALHSARALSPYADIAAAHPVSGKWRCEAEKSAPDRRE